MKALPYTEDHKSFRESFRQFLKTQVKPYTDSWEKEGKVPKSIWKAIGNNGYLCPWVAPKYGGVGLDFLHSLVVNEELAKTNHAGLMVYLHSDIIVPYLNTFGSEKQKQRYLPGCVSGDVIMAVAMTEPDVGSDLASMTTTAVEDEDEVIINGSKTFISNGINCDLVIVAAKDPEVKNPYHSISLYLVEDGTPGFKKGEKIEKMGMHSQDTAELYFVNCRLPKENRLGEKGKGFAMLMQKLQQERLMVALQALYLSEYSLSWLIDFSKSGDRLSASQSFQFAIAEMATEVQIARTFLDQLVLSHMQEQDVSTETSMAKFWVTDLLKKTVSRALELVGIQKEMPLTRTWRDAQVYSIFAGTNEIMKSIIAKKIFNQV